MIRSLTDSIGRANSEFLLYGRENQGGGGMMANEWTPRNIHEVIADHRSLQILMAVNQKARSAQDLTNHCEGSLSSIYRRIDVLSDYNLLAENIQIDQEGHHYSVYETRFHDINISLDEGRVITEIQHNNGKTQYTQNEMITQKDRDQ